MNHKVVENNNNDKKKTFPHNINWRKVGIIVANLAAMFVVLMVLGWLALKGLDAWTRHGQEAIVPDVKGLSFNQAVDKMTAEGFKVELLDSIYDDTTPPGTVVDQNPRANTKVKPGREVYLVIKAFSPKTVLVPKLVDLSLRQATKSLESIGITDIRVVRVMSDYKDLVLAAKCNGRLLRMGDRISVKSQITLEVGEGMIDTPDFGDLPEGTGSDAPAAAPAAPAHDDESVESTLDLN